MSGIRGRLGRWGSRGWCTGSPWLEDLSGGGKWERVLLGGKD